MTTLFDLLSSEFPGDLAAAMVVNFQISALALLIGLALGLPLGLGMLGGRLGRGLSRPVLSVMRAAPTFVVMFFLLNTLPKDISVFGMPFTLTGVWIVALSLVPYAAAYAADNGQEAITSLRRGSVDGALLFLPNMVRAFFVLVMSSSTGAAIGVSEGVAVVLRRADQYADLSDKLVVFGIGVVAFGVVFQLGFGLTRWAVRALGDRHRTSAEV